MKIIIKEYLIALCIFIIMIDIIGFIMWSLSGQQPADSFFTGTITRSVINLIK